MRRFNRNPIEANRRNQTIRHYSCGIILLELLILIGCGSMMLHSRWLDRVVIVDGQNSEWQGALTYLDEQEASVGLLNDDRYLYVSLMSNNRHLQMQALRQGMTIWFDAEGGKNRSLGIRFPVGASNKDDMHEIMRPWGMDVGPDDLTNRFAESLKEVEIIRSASDDSLRMSLGEANNKDIFVQMTMSRGGFVYELRIPLLADSLHPVAIGTEAGGMIGIGLETPEFSMNMMRGHEGGGMFGGGMSPGGTGGGGGRMPGGGIPGGGRGFERPKPLKIWAKVQLASPDTAAPVSTENEITAK